MHEACDADPELEFVEEMSRLIAWWLTELNPMPAGNQRITIEQGATLDLRFNWKDSSGDTLDLSSGYTARMQVRRTHSETATLLSMTDSDGITLAATSPNIIVARTAAQTAAIATTERILGVWDLELVASDGTVTRLLEGEALITPEVTR